MRGYNVDLGMCTAQGASVKGKAGQHQLALALLTPSRWLHGRLLRSQHKAPVQQSDGVVGGVWPLERLGQHEGEVWNLRQVAGPPACPI